MRPVGFVGALILNGAGSALAQSGHLIALSGSTPAAVVSQLGLGARGVGGLWLDPSADVAAAGFIVSWQKAAVGSVELLHMLGAVRVGPTRWSAAYGHVEILDLFDSLLVGDPNLSSLRARAARLAVDGSTQFAALSVSAGLSFSGDENVGDYESTTAARVQIRYHLWPTLELGAHMTRTVGGSVPSGRGRYGMDLVYHRFSGVVTLESGVGIQWGRIWNMAEVEGCAGGRASAGLRNTLRVEGGGTRCKTTYGERAYEWESSVVVALSLQSWELGVRHTASHLAVGSGTSISLSYQVQRK